MSETSNTSRPQVAAWDAPAASQALAELAAIPLTALDKGFAGLTVPTLPTELIGVPLADERFSTPLMVLRSAALDHNIRVLAQFAADRGVLLAPHAKTTMTPEIFVPQLAAGAWGLTAANVTQARVYVAHGARRVVIANEVTGAAALASLRRLLEQTPELELYCYVDSVAGVALLEQAFGERPERAPLVLVEVGIPGGRTGTRSIEAAMDVARAAAGTTAVRVVGASAFEGPLAHETDVLGEVRALYERVRETGEALFAAGLTRPRPGGPTLVLSGGGSHDFDIVADVLGTSSVPDAVAVVRSGSYVTHDHRTYLLDTPSLRGVDIEPFEPAIEVHGTVLSRPEPTQAFVDFGRRDVSFDSGLPVVLDVYRNGNALDAAGVEVTDLNDQHGFLTIPATTDLQAGDRVVVGISHPCTTFDKWPHAVLVDADDRATGITHSFF